MGKVTVKIQGTGLTEDTVASLVNPAGATNVGQQVLLTDSTAMLVSFDLTGASAGPRHLHIEKPGLAPVALNNGFQIIAGTGPELRLGMTTPPQVRPGRDYTVLLDYENAGDADMLAPVLVVCVRGQGGINFPRTSGSVLLRLLCKMDASSARAR